ncbi:transcriptional regulator, TetR family [Desulfuromusa kysingii]|uniref:Transcriptional regulator, TetR family n=1 Tax=Desulfuromusa kysingii TaxID=37625 RepID=A0A1H3XE40_9BACT|nr:TetR/AcrR family transcriptional regulator [Desulfuromusa kysingii]SDZ97657.1 transcriptional regulator, TetR family [Desulfuromusa kysingii]
MPKTKKKNGNAVDLRQTILKTALILFTSKGYFNTSVHDIKRTADISIGAVYHHFKSKEEIAKAIYAEMLEVMTKSMDEIMVQYDSTQERAKAIMRMLFDWAETNPAEMEFMLHAKHKEFMPSAIPVCSSRPLAMMREVVQTGINNGEIREMDVTLAATCLFGGMFRMINLRLDGIFKEPLPPHLEMVWDCAWKGVAR